VAAHEGHAPVIEQLVGYGADLNATVEDGNTALHLILIKKNMRSLDQNSSYILQVEQKVKAAFGERNFARHTIVACMLLLEGADLYLKNGLGDSPLAICPPDIADVLRHVVEKCGRGEFHGSLRKFSMPLPKLDKKTATVATGDTEIVKAFPPKGLSKDSRHSESAEKPPDSVPIADDYTNKPSEKCKDEEQDLQLQPQELCAPV
jgi:hypothetical protein